MSNLSKEQREQRLQRAKSKSRALKTGAISITDPKTGEVTYPPLTQSTEAADKPHLKVVKTVEELAENFRIFQQEATRYPARRNSILRSTTYWVRDENSGAFGPGKFLGFKWMHFGIYELASKMDDTFNGNRSRVAIEAVLDKKFEAAPRLIAELQEWGERMFGAGAFGGANTDKWQFLRFAIPGREAITPYPNEITQPETFDEGASTTVSVNIYERDPRARAKCIAHYGTKCVVCGLGFVERYGEIGKDFIHVHHAKPLGEIGKKYSVDPVRDMRPVCPNCHAMLHQKKPCITIEELKAVLK